MTDEEDSPWLCRDQRRGALESCVHPHRPWSKSHTLSDGGEVAAAAARGGEGEEGEREPRGDKRHEESFQIGKHSQLLYIMSHSH